VETGVTAQVHRGSEKMIASLVSKNAVLGVSSATLT